MDSSKQLPSAAAGSRSGRWQASAPEALQGAAEAYLVGLFEGMCIKDPCIDYCILTSFNSGLLLSILTF